MPARRKPLPYTVPARQGFRLLDHLGRNPDDHHRFAAMAAEIAEAIEAAETHDARPGDPCWRAWLPLSAGAKLGGVAGTPKLVRPDGRQLVVFTLDQARAVREGLARFGAQHPDPDDPTPPTETP